ncbi:MAG TPA: tyrosine-type recombinase/integrase [Rariglobus sp.]
MSGRTKRAAATKAQGNFLEREESEVWRGQEGWGDDWKSEAADEDKEAAAAAAASPPAKRRKARAPEVRDQPEGQDPPPTTKKVETHEDVRADVLEWMRDHRNQNTATTYASAWRQFEKWAKETANPQRAAAAHVDLQRPDPVDVAAYMRHIVMVKGGTMQSVDGALAGIANQLRFTDHHPTDSAMVRAMRQVLTPKAKPAGQKKEMAWRLLEQVWKATEKNGSILARRDGALMLLAYFGFLRTSEIARMKRNEIRFETRKNAPRVMHVHVNRMCKNDPERKGHWRLIEERPAGEICALRVVEGFMRLDAGQDGNRPLFPTEAGGQMHADTPRGRLLHWMKQAGVQNRGRYGFHSLRAGAATAAAKAGVSEEHIKMHGNWQSDAVRVYIRPDMEDRLRASGALGKRKHG